MDPTTCPECESELGETEDTCSRCGASLRVEAPPLMSLLSEAQAPPASAAQITLTRVAAIALIGWLCVIAGLSWNIYNAGYIEIPLPLWNSFFVVGTIPLVIGVFSRRLWAQRWVLGIALFTGIGNVMQASRADSTLLWVGAIALGGVALVM